MVYIHDRKWTLYEREISFSDKSKIKIYVFSTKIPKNGTPCDLPEGYTVGVNKRTGLPYAKRK